MTDRKSDNVNRQAGRQEWGRYRSWQRGFALPLWQRVLVIGALTLAGIAAAVVTTALLVVALPLLLLAGFLIQRAVSKRMPRPENDGPASRPKGPGRVIEGEYRVVEEEQQEETRRRT